MEECEKYGKTRVKRDNRKDMEHEGNSCASGKWKSGGCDHKLGEWLQMVQGEQSKISVQESAVLETAKMLCRSLKLPGLSYMTQLKVSSPTWGVGGEL